MNTPLHTFIQVSRLLSGLTKMPRHHLKRAWWPLLETQPHWIHMEVDAGVARWVFAYDDQASARALPTQLLHPDLRNAWPVRVVRAPRCVQHAGAPGIGAQNGRPDDGTVAALLRSRSGARQPVLLTAAHVVAAHPQTQRGDSLVVDGNLSADLLNWRPVLGTTDRRTYCDAAIAAIDEATRTSLLSRYPDLEPKATGWLTTPGTRLRVRCTNRQLEGRYVGYWSGWLDAADFPGTEDYRLEYGLTYRSLGAGPQGGDSGAALLDEQGRLLGIHCGGLQQGVTDWDGVACGIQPILSALDCGVAPPTAGAASPAPPAAPNTLGPAALSPPNAPRVGGNVAGPVELVLARTLCGEASNQGPIGMTAVAHVVLNRVRKQSWFGKTIAEVCQKRNQFSCWNFNDPNRSRIEKLMPGMRELDQALAIAKLAVKNPPQLAPDSTGGATHYYATSLKIPPIWSRGKVPSAHIGQHIFFTNID